MRLHVLSLALLATLALSFAVCLEPWFQSWKGSRTKSDNILQTALGDGRKLFASHIYAKADAYFHNGYYPSMFDNKGGSDKTRIAEEVHKHGDEECADDHLGKPRDWIDAFGRHFYPARHTHLGDGGCGHSCCPSAKGGQSHDENCDHKGHGKEHHAAKRADEREILPWLRLSAELDPERVETYVVCAYWLRGALNKPEEAERFLREGLRVNPGNFELLFELGRVYYENRKDVERARNVWELALKKWHEHQDGVAEPNIFLRAQILAQLAALEERQNNFPRAIELLNELKTFSPNKDGVQKWIDGLQPSPGPGA